MMTIPNMLTIARMIAVPALVGLFYLPQPAAAWATFGLFVAAAVTDYLDGWLARRLNQMSEFGRALDPVADKLIVAAVLIMLTLDERAHVIAVIAILARELLIAGLRESLAGKLTIPVSQLAKWKTATQMIALAVMLIAPVFAGETGDSLGLAGEALLWLAVALTWVTAANYVQASLRHFSKPSTSDGDSAS